MIRRSRQFVFLFPYVIFSFATIAFGQGAPIIGSAPVTVQSGTATPFVSSTFTADVVVDLSSVAGLTGGAPAPAGLSAFRIPVTFDRTRLQLISVSAGAGSPFSTVPLSTTAVSDANTGGRLSIAATLTGAAAPTGRVPVVTLTFRANAIGAATIAGDSAAISLASAVQVSGATVYGPVAIPFKPAGGGVTVQTPPVLRLSMTAGPSPTVNNGQIVYTLHAENIGGSPAHSATINATVPTGTSLIGASGAATVSGSNVVWNLGDLDAAATYDATFGVAVTALAGTTISIAPATAAASDAAAVLSNAVPVPVAATPTVKPGMIVTETSYGYAPGAIYDVTSGTPVQFARINGGSWSGALLFTPTGRLIAAADSNGGSLFDATAGGDLTAAKPIASGLGGYITGLAADSAGNLYVSSLTAGTQIKKVSPSGSVSAIGPVLQYPGSLLINGNTLYVSEGGSGSVKKIDLTTFAVTTLATGFPAGTDHFAGQLVRDSQNKIYVLWGQGSTNLGLFDITAGGNFASATPLTARNTFRIDVNQVAIDSHDNIYFAGDGTSAVWRSLLTGGVYGAVSIYANSVSEAEALAIYPLPNLPLIVLTSSSSLNPAVSSRPLTYTINYENRGGLAANNATLSATVPAGATFSSATNSGTFDGTKVTWTLGTVAAGATGSRSFTVNVTASAGGSLDPGAITFAGDAMTPVSSALPQLAVTSPPDLRITATPSATSAPLNSYLIYTLNYSNNSGATSPNTTIRQTLPANTTFASADQGGTLSGSVITWNAGNLAAGQSGFVTAVVKVGGSAGTVIVNNNCTLSGDLTPAVTAPSVSTTVTAASFITASLVAAPNPVVPGTQVNVVVTYKNTATTAANNVIITAPLPSSATYLSSNNGGAVAGGNVVWSIPQVAAGASGSVRYSIRVNAAPNTSLLTAALVKSDENALAGVAPSSVAVKPYPTILQPGTIIDCPSYSDSNIGRISAFQNGVKTFFAQMPRGSWDGPLLIGSNGHVYGSVDGYVYDITAGGDLTGATPIAFNSAPVFGQSMAFDDAGNLYKSSNNPSIQMEKITPEGDESYFGPVFQHPSGMTISGNTMWVSEGATGTVNAVDLTTGAKTVLASGFPRATDHFCGQLMRTRFGRLYVMWGAGANGLFDVTNGGTYPSTLTRLLPFNTYIDVNQGGIAPNDDIYLAGAGDGIIVRSQFLNNAYQPFSTFASSMGDNEALAIFPAYKLTVAGAASPSHGNRGDNVTVTFTVQNIGIVDTRNVSIDVPLPAGLTFVSAGAGGNLSGSSVHWGLPSLAAGGSASVSLVATLVGGDGSTVTITNYTASADGRATATGSDIAISIDKPLNIQAAAAPEPVVVGGLITYTLTYENLNAGSATNAVVTDTLPAGTSLVSVSNGGVLTNGVVSWNVGTIAAGASGALTFVVRVNVPSPVVNATYSVTSPEFGTRAGASVTTTVLPLPAQLTVSASGPAQVTAGQNITYTFTYGNGGGSTATQAVLRDTIPAGTTFVAATGGTLSGTDVVWQLGNIASGAQGAVSVTVTTSANATASVTNAAYSLTSGTQTATGAPVVTSLASPPPPAPLVVTMAAVPSPVATGALLTYTITITNPDIAAADGVVVSDTLPVGTTFVSATGPATTTGSSIQWTFGTLAPGESVAVGLTASVTANGGATITNSGATATATGRATGASGQVQTQVSPIAATLSLATTAPVAVLEGGSITYTLRWTNSGPSVGQGATITAPLPAGTTFLSLSNGGSFANGVATWPIGDLAPATDGYVTMTVAVTVPAGSTIALSGVSIAAQPSLGAAADTFLTTVVAPLPAFTGSLTLDNTLYVVPDVVHEVAALTYVSGGSGLLSGLTATLATVTDSGTVVATQTRTIDSLAAGTTIPMTLDWPTSASPTANYTANFTVTAPDGSVLVQNSVPFSVAAPDGAGLAGTIAATNSPAVLGTNLICPIQITNDGKASYSPLPLEIDVVDPATLTIIERVPAPWNVAAGVTESFTANVPTSGLPLGTYTLWLTTTAGGGTLLAQTTATVIAPTFTFSPPQSTVAAGATVTLTATLSTAEPVPLDVLLVSSDPTIASVPAKVTIPAGSTTATVNVTGVAPGGPVTITGTLSPGGTTATATVRVVMTGTITAIAEVYEGESEQFGVSITNGGQSAITNGAFTIEVRNAQTGSVVDTIPFTASVAAGATFQKSFPYSTGSLAAQLFEVDLVWSGITPEQTLATAPFKINKSPLLRATAAVGANPRILIWANCSAGNSGSSCTPVAPPFLTSALTAAGIRYVIVGDEFTFLQKMRSGTFSGAIIDQAAPAEPKIAPEYLGDIEGGFGLLFIHASPNAMPKLSTALATSFGGTLHGPVTLALVATPFTHAGTLTLNGNGVKIGLAGAKAAATLSGATDPAITFNTYGRGNVVVIPFDLELTRTAAVADLIVSATRFISRAPAVPLDAQSVVPIQVAVTTPAGSSLSATVTVTLPQGVAVVDASPDLTSTNPATWQSTIAPSTTANFILWVRASDAAGSYSATVTAALTGGPPVVTINVPIDVSADGAAIAANLQSDLAALKAAATTSQDVKNITDAMAQWNAIASSTDATANVARATQLLLDLHAMSIDTAAARTDASRLLIYWQSKVGA